MSAASAGAAGHTDGPATHATDSEALFREVRPEWLLHVIRAAKTLAAIGARGDASFSTHLKGFVRFATDLETAPHTVAEGLVLRGLLLEASLASLAHDPEAFRGVLPKLLDWARNGSRQHTDTCQLLSLCELSVSPTRSHSESILSRAHRYLQQDLQRPVTVKSLATELAISPRALQERFRAECGMSLSKYLQYVRLKEAMRLLSETDLKVEAVSLLVGWRSKRHLYRMLNTTTGLRPSQFRGMPCTTYLALLSQSRLIQVQALGLVLHDTSSDEVTPQSR